MSAAAATIERRCLAARLRRARYRPLASGERLNERREYDRATANDANAERASGVSADLRLGDCRVHDRGLIRASGCDLCDCRGGSGRAGLFPRLDYGLRDPGIGLVDPGTPTC